MVINHLLIGMILQVPLNYHEEIHPPKVNNVLRCTCKRLTPRRWSKLKGLPLSVLMLLKMEKNTSRTRWGRGVLKRSSKKSIANFSSKTFEGTNGDLFFLVCWAIWRGWPNSIKNHRDQGWPTGSIVAKLATNEWASTTWCLRNPPMITNWNVLKKLV